jgi:ankyrin repeat protein
MVCSRCLYLPRSLTIPLAAAQAHAVQSQEAPSQRSLGPTLNSGERITPNGTREESSVPQSVRTKLGRELHSEIKAGRIQLIESLLNQGADVDFENDVTDPAEPALEGCTPLQAAIIRRQLGIARLLLDHGVNVEAKNACLYDLRAINLVAVGNSDPFMRLLIGKHADLNARTGYGLIPLMEAVLHASFVSFRLLLEAGADVDLRMEQGQRPISSDVITIKGDNFEEGCTTEGSTALLLAAQNGELSMVDDLLARGADIECPTSSGPPGITPLIAAAANGHIRVIWSLLDHGCNIHAKAQEDFTALIYAAHYGREQVVTMLIDRGADIEGEKDAGMTALHEAAFCGRAVVVGVLLDKGARIEARAGTMYDMSEPTPLHIAARCGHAGFVRVLVRRGADVAARTGDDRTALDLAQTYDMAEVVDALLARNT